MMMKIEMSESSIEPEGKQAARREIYESLRLSIFCMRWIGLSFEKPKTALDLIIQKGILCLSVFVILYHVFSEVIYIVMTLANNPLVEDVVPLFHTMGYGALSIAKVFVLWYKKAVFIQLLDELVEIWPVPPLQPAGQAIKTARLTALNIAHKWYFMVNIMGVWFYNVTPFVIFFYRRLYLGQPAQVGFVWTSWYPFDKHKPFGHVFAYIFEMIAGQVCVWIMVSTDLLFSAMASHMGLLLKLLHLKLETLGTKDKTPDQHYGEILENIKLHQRLIRYCSDLEEAFSLSNLINVVLSSINICCVVFVIVLLEPLIVVSNKLFLVSALLQMFILCWYADDIYHASMNVAVAAYNNQWYRTNPRCRRALKFLIQRSQKPIAFTAMGFTNISLATYTSILTRSYSYFTLLYTMFKDHSKSRTN